MSKFSQRGISLYLSIIIMVILLAIVLGMSGILLGQLKMIKGMENSVVAFYAADTGIERILKEYYDNAGVISDPEYFGFLDLNGDGQPTTGVCPDVLSSYPKDACYRVLIVNGGVNGCDPANTYCLQSSGVYQETRRAIEVEL